MTPRRAVLLFGALLCGQLLSLAAHATDIYLWVDERGRVQLSDTVPDKYKATAKKVDSQRFELTPQQQAEGRARAAQQQQEAAKADADLAATRRQAEAGAARKSAGAIEAAAKPAGPAADCAAAQRAYVRSQECFAPYVLADGGVKEEAYRKCSVVLDPSSRCGILPLE